MLREEGPDFFQAVLAGIGIGIIPVRNQYDLDVQPFFEGQADATLGCMDTRSVAVEHQHQVLRIFVDDPDLVHGEGSAAGGHDVRYAQLVHAQHVEIAFDDVAAALADHLGPSEIQTV